MQIKKPFITRWIKRKFNELLLEWVEVWVDWNFKVNPVNADRANNYLVAEMCEVIQEEVDALSDKQFDDILNKINSIKSPL